MPNVVSLLSVVAVALAAPLALAEPAPRDPGVEVRKLLDNWVAAQNTGDFLVYQTMYAERFTGVRRSGARVVKLDRKGWMKDRGRMFSRPMTVRMDDTRITPMGGGAVVDFTQTWQSGSYHDTGRKRVVMVMDKGALRFAREEMLRSIVEERPLASRGERDPFLMIVEGGVVLSSDVKEAFVKGKPRIVSASAFHHLTAAVDERALPPALAAWRGRKVRLYNVEGAACEVTIKSLRIDERVSPHFGTVEEWNHLKEGERAAAAWELGRDGRLLLGELTEDAACHGQPLWARAVELPAPKLVMVEKADPALRARVIAEMEKLPAWKKLNAEWWSSEGADRTRKSWDEEVLDVSVMRLGALTLISTVAQTGEPCSDGFGGQTQTIWELVKDKLVLRNTPGEGEVVVPESAADLDGDGTIELLRREGILRRGATGNYDSSDTLKIPDYDCPC